MAKISEYTIEQVRSHADIVDVVSEFVDLKKKGRNFFGLCPFHGEKTASFSVSQEKQIYHCFGCGAGGGSIHFIMEIEKLEFVDAIKYLADKLGIAIQFDQQSRGRQLISQLEEIHQIAVEHFHSNLATKEGKSVLAHLQKRGLSTATIEKFKLGYSTSDWQSLLNIVRKENFTPEALLQCGLFIQSEKGHFDRFRSRIMFPIHNAMGKIVAFAGRVHNSDDPAKYVNSPETPLYYKSKMLYGLWAVKQRLREYDSIIIVEGYLDFLQLYQAGIDNVVAVSGTAFTDDHSRELRKYTNKVILAYDGDNAGRKAAIRAGYLLLRNDLDPKIVKMPVGVDPDDWVKSDGPDPFKAAVNTSAGLIEFHAGEFSDDMNNPVEKTRFAKTVLQEITQIPDEITKQVYIQHLSSINQIPEQALYKSIEQMNKSRFQRGRVVSKGKEESENIAQKESSHQLLEDEIILLCFSDDEHIRNLIKENLTLPWFRSENAAQLFTALLNHWNRGVAPEPASIMDGIESELLRRKFSTLIYRFDEFTPTMEHTVDCLYRMEDRFLKRKQNQLRTQLRDAEANKENITELIGEIDGIHQARKSLQTKYRNVDN